MRTLFGFLRICFLCLTIPLILSISPTNINTVSAQETEDELSPQEQQSTVPTDSTFTPIDPHHYHDPNNYDPNHHHGDPNHHDDEYWAKLSANDEPFKLSAVDLIKMNMFAADVGGEWGPVITWPHTPVSMANLPDGRIFTWSGSEPEHWPVAEQTYAAAWDPKTGLFTPYFNDNHNMFCAEMVSLDDGRIMAMGGRNTVDKVSIFDPLTNAWSQETSMNSSRWYPTGATLGDGSVFVAVGKGGRYPERWDEGQGWTHLLGVDLQGPILDYGANKDGAGWWPLMHLDPRGHIFHYGATPEMHSIDPNGNGSITNLGPNNLSWFPEEATAIMYDEGKILVSGGAIDSTVNTSSNKAAIIDITNPSPVVTEIAPMNIARQFSNEVILPTGEVLVIGGNTTGAKFSDSGTVLDPEIWDPTTQTWTLLNAMSVPRNYHSTAILLPDGRVLAAGGGYSSGDPDHPATHTDGQVFSPPYLFQSDGTLAPRPIMTAAPTSFAIGKTFIVESPDNIQRFTMIRMSATTHTMNTGQRFLEVPFNSLGGNQYELTAHSNANVLVPGYWMLFSIDNQGVPSASQIIRVFKSPLPDVSNPGKQTNVRNGTVHLQINAEDDNNNPLTYSASGLPTGLSINSTTGLISGIPDTIGTYNTSVTVADGTDGSTTVEFEWIIFPDGQGTIIREWWTGLSGNAISNLTSSANFPDNPTGVETLTVFEGPINWLDSYGSRIYGYLYPPTTGNYTFWISSDDNGELWLSSNLDPANKVLIANVPGWSSSREWNKYAEQQSTSIFLEAGRKYYIEALQKEGGGGDNLAVAWQKPGDSTLSVIDGIYLSPYQNFENISLGKSTSQSSDYSNLFLSENAVDGNIDGNFGNGSLSHTLFDTQAWWQVDLGAIYDIDTITLWNREDCCADRLSNFHVLISMDPFNSTDLTATQNQAGVLDHHYPGTAPRQTDFPINNLGRYVRIQLAGTNNLQLAEVQIFGSVATGVPLTLNPMISSPAPTGTAVNYTANYSGGDDPQFKWLFGDSSPETAYSDSPSVTHTFSQPGRYLVTLTALNDGQEQSIQFYQAIYNQPTANQPTHSSPIIYETRTGDDRVWNVNPDNDTVTIINAVNGDKIAEIGVGAEPNSLGLAANGRIWVINSADASITTIDTDSLSVVQTLPLAPGSEPYGVAFAPDGNLAYIALEATGKLLKFDVHTMTQTGQADVGQQVRHLAVAATGNRIYLSRFITPQLPGEESGVPQTSNVGGEVIVVDPGTMSIVKTAVLQVDNGSDFEAGARGVPNYLSAPIIAPDGLSAWVPSKKDNILRGALRDGLNLNFEHTVRAIASYIDMGSESENFTHRLDLDNASVSSAAAFGLYGNYLFIALETSREIAVVDAYSRSELFRFNVGRAPQGVVVSADGLTLYVYNFMDRSVSIHDLTALISDGIQSVSTIATTTTVANETLSAQILNGKQLFYDAADDRLAQDNYMSCASCHNGGGQDGRIWDLTDAGEGLRNTISLEGHGNQGPLHWTGNFDEVQDFEGQIRSLAGGTGLLTNAQFNNTSDPLGTPKAGLSADLDALAAYVNSLSSVGNSPFRNADGTLSSEGEIGKQIFIQNSCAACHGGVNFTDSALNNLHDVGTISQPGSGQRLGANLTGFDTPTLRGLWQTSPYLHNGSANTLADAVDAHAGVSLTTVELNSLVTYLSQIDDSEPMISLNTPPVLTNPGNQTNDEGDNVSLQIVATDTDGDVLSYSATGLPTGLSISSSSGLIVGTPTAAGNYNVALTVADGQGGSDNTNFTWTINDLSQNMNMVFGAVTNLDSGWQTVTLNQNYSDMVVVASLEYGLGQPPAVVRIRNASGNSFEIQAQNPSGQTLSGYTAHYLVVEAGTYTVAEHGVKMEAVKVLSTQTDRKGSWLGEQQSYLNTYSNPVVIGQVMSANDADWSSFWARGSSAKSPPNASNLYVGKQVGEDIDTTRADETIAYIVIEAGSGLMNDLSYEAAVGADIVRGPDNAPPYTYALSTQRDTAIVSTAAMDGNDGGWPTILSLDNALDLVVNEDQIRDAETRHTTEQVAYLALSYGNNQAPGVTNPGDQTNDTGETVNLAISANDPDGNTLSYSATGLPAGLSIDSDSGVIAGAPNTVGNYNVTVSVADGNGGSDSVNFTWTIGETIVCTTYSSTDIPQALPNGTASISSDLIVNNNGLITDIDVTIDMSHPWVGDLSFILTHQASNSSVTLIDRPGLPASTYGCDAADLLVTLDDAAALPVEEQCGESAPTINGTFTPNNPLSAFNGLSADGTWVLTVTDDYTSADSGTLNAWQIQLCTQ